MASLDEHRELMRYSICAEAPSAAVHRGYTAGYAGMPVDKNPYPRRPCVNRRGRTELNSDGTVKVRGGTKSHFEWLAGYEEGAAAREGQLLKLLLRRRAESASTGTRP